MPKKRHLKRTVAPKPKSVKPPSAGNAGSSRAIQPVRYAPEKIQITRTLDIEVSQWGHEFCGEGCRYDGRNGVCVLDNVHRKHHRRGGARILLKDRTAACLEAEARFVRDQAASNPTGLKMIEAYLREHGFDGLYNDDCGDTCGCRLGDLAPCGEKNPSLCRAGYIQHDVSEFGDHLVGPIKR